MTLHAVPTPLDHADEVHGLADRLGVSNEKLHSAEHERDRLRTFVVEMRADHVDNGSHFCAGDHAAMFTPFPCEIRDECDKALCPTCKRCGAHRDVNLDHLCHLCARAPLSMEDTCRFCKGDWDACDCTAHFGDERYERPGSDER